MSAIKFIYSDLAGVQYDFRRGIRQLTERQGVAYDDFAKQVAEYEEQANKSNISVKWLIEIYNNILGLHMRNENEYIEYWTNTFTPIREIHTLIPTLAQKYQIGILTNIHEQLLDTLFEKKLISYIPYTAIVQSFEVKHTKPEKEIFLLAQVKANVAPEEILFIDDNPTYIQKAKELGWNGIVFDQNNIQRSLNAIVEALQ